ncbi:MAG TPA: alpha-galactosidase [Anaerolineae bacterium]
MTVYARHDGHTLVIGNQWIERRFAAQAGALFHTTAFLNKISNRDYGRAGGREFCFSVDGRSLSGADFVLERIEIRDDQDPVEIVAHLRAPALAVRLHTEVYADHPVIRKWLEIENRGTESIRLNDLDWEELNLLVDTPTGAEVWTDYFTRREKSARITMDDCALLVNDSIHHEGFILATEAPGPLKRLEAYAQPARIAVGYNRDDETVFERILAPGETFRTAASFILVYANPIPQDVVDDAYARYVQEHLTACDVSQVPTITVNTWVPHLYDLNRALLLEQIEVAAELGVDAYQVDAGWYDRLGDWNADTTKFPNGLEEIANQCRARGMRFGLWMAIATVDETSQVFVEHPDWIARDRAGQPNRHPMPGAVTMCLDSGYYDFILEKIDAQIRRYQVDLLKLDLSTVRNLYVPGKYPGCFAPNHTHRSPNDSHLRIVERLFDLVRTLKQRHPRCLIDLSYEAYGVMDGTDPALTHVADQNWFTNIASPNEVDFRREVYERGRATRPWTLNFGGTILDHPNALNYGLFSTLTSHGLFWGDLTRLDDRARAHFKRWFAWTKQQRAYSDFYRYYKVSNVFPVPDGISSRDYRHSIPTERYGIPPLGIHPPAFEPISEHPGELWDGVARLDARGEGPIFLFRPAACRTPFFGLRVPWVEPAASYRVTDEVEQRELAVLSGAELIEQGLEIHIDETSAAKIILLRLA